MPLRVRIRARVAERAPGGRRIHQAIFAQAVPRLVLPRLRHSDDPAAPAFAAAAAAIMGRGIAPSEAEWIARIEQERASLGRRPGSVKVGSPPVRTIEYRQLAGVSSIHRPWGAFLLRLVRELRPQSCLELGGAIGISAAYQGAALELNGGGVLRSVEGWVNLVTEARELLGRLGLDRVEVIHSRFEDVLEEMLPRIAPIDLVFLDASKRLEDNLRQFEQLLPHFASGGVLVLDDVHWSPEMKRAWGEIRSHPRVALSADLWRLGACVLRD